MRGASANPTSDPPATSRRTRVQKNYLWKQEPDVLWDPVLERSHQEKLISDI